ncbi:nucleotide sugar dehydrogenase [Halobacillus halophilus]|uniref:UDP-N-acetyl-D-mannosamine dehydrogenase n=1 Tax=Halobacillus halophilus (strain ATCC 35676 / DSM 2266 / JCM 20832 / KCTC 3685 / LMG 17431 / NBRC 102448 / NCIMB 2269) TaxID=866895 RepID=I0JRJ5_HALH3|nr:nucleotide sugar dehydrogenase [Halobacillus halophilus]ASF40739.1 nucleotide sugar dehydrogenase [Halobacillus halophilus]CCG46766.1 UDP-N-acetyl-D-mannosamine dehydrogenase [Halobacillus halophilus DSM 2266]
MDKKLCVIGLGYIGLPTAAVFANYGWNVQGVDVNDRVIETLNKGEVHIEEFGLATLVKEVVSKGYLTADNKPSEASVFIIAVPTPHNENLTANLSYLISATESLLPYLKKDDTIIIESTIPPRTIDDVVGPIISNNGWSIGEDVFLAHCPERVLPGNILKELINNNRIIGGFDSLSAHKAAEVYKTFVKGEVIETVALSAEMAKLMENTFRDVNISLANELAKISEKLNVNTLDVIELANLHPRVNLHTPGPGVGGHCLAVDPYFIIEKAHNEAKLISTAREINNSMPMYIVEQIDKLYQGKGHIGILGITYKGNVDDIRESPALKIINELLDKGYEVKIHDPYVKDESTIFKLSSFEEVIEGSECLLVLSDHNEFIKIDEEKFINKASKPVIFDTKNCMKITNNDIKYINYNNLYLVNEVQSNFVY